MTLLEKVISTSMERADVTPEYNAKLNVHQESFFSCVGAKNIYVYREFNPMRDEMEYFFLFDKDGSRHRASFTEFTETVERLRGEAAEWFLVGRAVQVIMDGKYEDW